MDSVMAQKSTLILEDGSSFTGYAFGAHTSTAGECVFQTGMVGYPEALTDPSYKGQILVFSHPMIGNYGVPDTARDELGMLKFFESEKIHVAAIIIADYCTQPSHWNSVQTLSDYLKSHGVPGIYGIDTRALIKKIRERGTMMGKIAFGKDDPNSLAFVDINKQNLVAEVSTKQVKVYGTGDVKILAFDCGMKYNQIRCFLKRKVQVKVVPWDYDASADNDWDGLFVSNGPGDPMQCSKTVETLRKIMQSQDRGETKMKPIFGICLGNQLLGLAAGAKTYKLKYGNRGQNQPCVDQRTGKCYMTSQNHGFAIDQASLPEGWVPLFVNANDFTNEGIAHLTKPYFSVQFHPEAKAGPVDTEFLFDSFLEMVRSGKPLNPPPTSTPALPAGADKSITKVLVLGSGGLTIGQAGEFDYSGSQAIKALKEEGIKTILINPNVATVQTSPGLADRIYFLPVNVENVVKVIENERPDGILVSFGGQTALNCGVELYKKGILDHYGIRVLGTPIDAVIATEDRGIFAEKLKEIGESIAPSFACATIEEAVSKAELIGYPVIVRAAYCLGGLGSGFAYDRAQLTSLVTEALSFSEQVLVEKSLKGWKEIEYEVLRDYYDNCITVCNMENFDPLGIHTGESIVVAPSQTLTDTEYHMLRQVAIKVVRHLGIIGECNIQYALNPESEEYCIIEVNARLSRSSALASKATGYPLAFASAKIALGVPLPVLRNPVTKTTTACFEPSLDYIVVKMPRWDLRKFSKVSTKIDSSMKSVGEVMAIGRTFEESIQKAIRMVGVENMGGCDGFSSGGASVSDEELEHPSDQRIFVIASALKSGYPIDKLYQRTRIDKWFLNKLKNIIDIENDLERTGDVAKLGAELLRRAKRSGFSDKQIARLTRSTELAVRDVRKSLSVLPHCKQIDTVAGEFPAQNNYLYVTYNAEESDVVLNEPVFVILGSGVYRIGSSVEFDWCAVSCARTLRGLHHKTLMINYNPETVSTDYDECDYLLFEELSFERVMDVIDGLGANNKGIILSVGGQVPNNLAIPLSRQNVKILGTLPEMIDTAENRYKFSRLLDSIGVDQPQWKELTSLEDMSKFCEAVGYPCLVRPSYVLSGAAMNVVHSTADLQTYLSEAVRISPDHPVVISKFISEAKEIEVDAVADGGSVVAMAISEHIENAGVHSGDATIVFPAQDLDELTIKKVKTITQQIAAALNVTGPFNIQYIAKNNEVKVIECNLRASRSFPFISKTLNANLIEIATKLIIGLPVSPITTTEVGYVGVKVPQFSFTRLKGADPILGVEMASTGEVACFGPNRHEAYLKGLQSTGFRFPKKNILISIGSFKEKYEFIPAAKKLVELGYVLFGTPGTADFLSEQGIQVTDMDWKEEDGDKGLSKQLTAIYGGIDLIINLPSKNKYRRPASFMSRGYAIRRTAVDLSVPLITNIKCAKLFVDSLTYLKGPRPLGPWDVRSSHRTVVLPGLIDVHVHVREPGATHKEDWDTCTAAALAGGVTMICAMPNTNPAVFDVDTVAFVHDIATKKARCDFGLFVGASADAHLVAPAADHVVGIKMYLDHTFGNLKLDNLADWIEHFKHMPDNLPVAIHAESKTLASALLLGAVYNKPTHVCHVALKEEIEIIKAAKKRGLRVTCEVTPHHLLFTTKDTIPIGDLGTVRPAVGTEEDRLALWENFDIIDCIATDHAPHLLAEKLCQPPYKPPAPPGFPGVETVVTLMLNLVAEGRITMNQLVEKMYINPMKIYNLPKQLDTFIEVDLDETWVIPQKTAFCRSQWTPFAGRVVKGKVFKVVLRGKLAYIDGKVLVPPGNGLDIKKSKDDKLVMSPPTVTGGSVLPSVLTSSATLIPMTLASYIGVGEHVSTAPEEPAASIPTFHATASMLPSPVPSATEFTAAYTNLQSPAKPQPPAPTSSLSSSSQALSPLLAPMPAVPPAQAIVSLDWRGKHVLNVEQFSRKDLHALFNTAQRMRAAIKRSGTLDVLKGKTLTSLYYKANPSKSCFFGAAMQKLGGTVITLSCDNDSLDSFDLNNGTPDESLYDTVKTAECYSDVVVLRYFADGTADKVAPAARKPLINGGDSVDGENPTQALSDVFTVRDELGTVNGLTITLVGDLTNCKTAHSVVKLLALYDVKLNYVSPDSLRMPASLVKELKSRGVHQQEHNNLEAVLPTTDVLYVAPMRSNKFASPAEYQQAVGALGITPHRLTLARDNLIILHPLPRQHDMVSHQVDSDPRACYFRSQGENNVFVRMGILATIMGRANQVA